MIHDTYASDGRDGPVEEKFSVVEIDVSAEWALEKLHESKGC